MSTREERVKALEASFGNAELRAEVERLRGVLRRTWDAEDKLRREEEPVCRKWREDTKRLTDEICSLHERLKYVTQQRDEAQGRLAAFLRSAQ